MTYVSYLIPLAVTALAVALIAMRRRRQQRRSAGTCMQVGAGGFQAVRVLRDQAEIHAALLRAAQTEQRLAGIAAERYTRHRRRVQTADIAQSEPIA